MKPKKNQHKENHSKDRFIRVTKNWKTLNISQNTGHVLYKGPG